MRIVCTKKNLNNGLITATRVIGSGNTLPILNNILFKTDEGRLKLSGTNLEIAVNTWIGGKIEEEGEITVPAKIVNEYVNNLPAEKLTISTQNQTLYLAAEKAETHVKGLPSEDFPLIPKITEQVYARLAGKDLVSAIHQVSFAASYSETQPEISGVLFSFEEKFLTLAATDRYRLAEAKVPIAEEAASPRQVIIPFRAVNELGRIIGSGPVEILLGDGQICFRTADVELISRLIQGQYPDYKQIIPTQFTTETEVFRAELIQAIKAASLFASENNNIELLINPQSREMTVRAQSSMVGDSEIRVGAAITGQKNSIIFNFRYLLECLNNLDDEKINLKMISPTSPAAVVPVSREGYIYIVMPIKI